MNYKTMLLVLLVCILAVGGGWYFYSQKPSQKPSDEVSKETLQLLEFTQKPESFTSVDSKITMGDFMFTRDLKTVYMEQSLPEWKSQGKITILEADPATFTVLGVNGIWYAKDANHAFIGPQTLRYWGVIPTAHVTSFKVVAMFADWALAKDEKNVYSGNRKIVGADPKSFRVEVSENEYTIRDDNKIWWVVEKGGNLISEAPGIRLEEPQSPVIFANLTTGNAPHSVMFSVGYRGLADHWIEFGDGERVDIACSQFKPDTDACISFNKTLFHTYTKAGTYKAKYLEGGRNANGILTGEVIGSVVITVK